ncbi:hypothetical protein LNP05_29495 [Klebsiella pneumoniae subsp. pneumoniae]|nr:hypothetical protein [Klebsiella pneumoniae subsp. pneumoniae]
MRRRAILASISSMHAGVVPHRMPMICGEQAEYRTHTVPAAVDLRLIRIRLDDRTRQRADALTVIGDREDIVPNSSVGSDRWQLRPAVPMGGVWPVTYDIMGE